VAAQTDQLVPLIGPIGLEVFNPLASPGNHPAFGPGDEETGAAR